MWRWAPYQKAATKSLLQRLAELEHGGEHKTLHPPHQVVAKRRRDLSEWFSLGLSGAVIVGGVGLLVLQLASTRDGRGDLPRVIAHVRAPPAPIWTGIPSALPSHYVWESDRVQSGETAHAEYSNRQ